MSLDYGYFNSMRAMYRLIIPPEESLQQCIANFESAIKEAIPQGKEKVDSRWEGEPYTGRNLVLFNPSIEESNGQKSVYAVFEFTENEREFYVVDSIRQTNTRESICNLLDDMDLIVTMGRTE